MKYLLSQLTKKPLVDQPINDRPFKRAVNNDLRHPTDGCGSGLVFREDTSFFLSTCLYNALRQRVSVLARQTVPMALVVKRQQQSSGLWSRDSCVSLWYMLGA